MWCGPVGETSAITQQEMVASPMTQALNRIYLMTSVKQNIEISWFFKKRVDKNPGYLVSQWLISTPMFAQLSLPMCSPGASQVLSDKESPLSQSLMGLYAQVSVP